MVHTAESSRGGTAVDCRGRLFERTGSCQDQNCSRGVQATGNLLARRLAILHIVFLHAEASLCFQLAQPQGQPGSNKISAYRTAGVFSQQTSKRNSAVCVPVASKLSLATRRQQVPTCDSTYVYNSHLQSHCIQKDCCLQAIPLLVKCTGDEPTAKEHMPVGSPKVSCLHPAKPPLCGHCT